MRNRRGGFSLVEIVVGLAILATLVGVFYPVVVQQIDKWSAMQVARDLSHIRIALEHFHKDTFSQPKYLTQTVHPITIADRSIRNVFFTSREVDRWFGPYIDNSLRPTLTAGNAIRTGFDLHIRNDIYCIAPGFASPAACMRGRWTVVLIQNMRIGDFLLVNELVDPHEEGMSTTVKRLSGRLMFASYGAIAGNSTPGDALYLATPYLD